MTNERSEHIARKKPELFPTLRLASLSERQFRAESGVGIDFASDVAARGRRLRIFSVVDSYKRECLTLEVDTSLPSRRVTRALTQIIETRGVPVAILSDKGPAMSSRHFLAGASSGSTPLTFNLANPRKTRLWKAFMVGCGMGV